MNSSYSYNILNVMYYSSANDFNFLLIHSIIYQYYEKSTIIVKDHMNAEKSEKSTSFLLFLSCYLTFTYWKKEKLAKGSFFFSSLFP
jgi:hypothetical protein